MSRVPRGTFQHLPIWIVTALAVAVAGAARSAHDVGHDRAAPGDAGAEALPHVALEQDDGTLTLKVGGEVVATYVYADPVITRPYFRDLRAPGGTPVSRAHPPVEGRDATDHADMHPGAWLAFADIGGADVWRNRAKVEHVRFVTEPAGAPGRGTFAVLNHYTDGARVICEETCRYTLLVRPAGYLLIADSTFRAADGPLAFGDQEEMGFGVRVATPITVKSGGRIIDNEGRENEAGIWGKEAAWVDYSGAVEGREAGVMLIPDPANPRPSRFHVRDYGLTVANPFGGKAFGDQRESRVVVPAGQEFRMGFAVLLHASAGDVSFNRVRAYEDCVKYVRQERHAGSSRRAGQNPP